MSDDWVRMVPADQADYLDAPEAGVLSAEESLEHEEKLRAEGIKLLTATAPAED